MVCAPQEQPLESEANKCEAVSRVAARLGPGPFDEPIAAVYNAELRGSLRSRPPRRADENHPQARGTSGS